MVLVKSLLLAGCLFAAGSSRSFSRETVSHTFGTVQYPRMEVYVERGFRLEGAGRLIIAVNSGVQAYNGTPVLSGASSTGPLNYTHADGLPFQPLGVDLSEYSLFSQPANLEVVVTAQMSNGTSDQVQFTLDGQIDGDQGPINDFQTFNFPSHWVDVVKLSFLSSGFAMDNLTVNGPVIPDDTIPPLPNGNRITRVVGTLPAASQFRNWKFHRWRGNDVLLAEFNERGHADRFCLFRSNGSRTVTTGATNPWTGERVDTLEGFDLLGNNGQLLFSVDDSAFPGIADGHRALIRAENGRIVYVVHWYNRLEDYAVFSATSAGVIPLLLPTGTMPDGGMPSHFPYRLEFEDGAVAFQSSTSLRSQDAAWFFFFPGAPLRMGVRRNDFAPGTQDRLSSLEGIVSLDRNGAVYYMRSATRLYLIRTNPSGISSVIGASEPVVGTVVEGCGVRCDYLADASVIDVADGTVYYSVGAESRTVWAEGVNFLRQNGLNIPQSAGAHIYPELSAQSRVYLSPYLANAGRLMGLSYMDGLKVVEFTSSPDPKTPRIGGPVRHPDGSWRFSADYLTLGLTYQIESAPSPLGPWTSYASFVPDTISRSFPMPLSTTPRFFRLRYPVR